MTTSRIARLTNGRVCVGQVGCETLDSPPAEALNGLANALQASAVGGSAPPAESAGRG